MFGLWEETRAPVENSGTGRTGKICKERPQSADRLTSKSFLLLVDNVSQCITMPLSLPIVKQNLCTSSCLATSIYSNLPLKNVAAVCQYFILCYSHYFYTSMVRISPSQLQPMSQIFSTKVNKTFTLRRVKK